jgi:tetratricopeptide (TPR) repeat protein
LPQQGEVWTNLTNSLLNIGRRAEALAAAVEGVEKYPDDVNIRISLGVALLSNGRPKEAIVEYNRAHTLSPKYFLPIVNLASAYSLVGEAEEARKWARLAMDRTDGSYNLLPLVPALSNIGDHAAAAELSEQIIKRDPSSAVAWNNHAVVLRRKRDLTEALECSARALQLNPRYAAAWCNRAVALISLSRYPEALEAAENALEIDPSMSNARGVLSKALSQMDRADEAVNILEDAVREFPDDTTNWTNLAVSYATIGRRADALSAVDEALRIDPRLSAAMKLKEHLLADI